jgi:hypothetical protein
LEAVKLIHHHLHEDLCNAIFQKTRTRERQRKWTLYALVRFWTAVVLRAPAALTQILQDNAGVKTDALFPNVDASPEAFFQKCRHLHWHFFAEIYRSFTQRILPEAPLAYAGPLNALYAHFPEVWIVDGSKCDRIARRLKLLWTQRKVPLPGCLTAFYDLRRGITQRLLFSAHVDKAELRRFKETLHSLPRGLLLVGDRLYGVPDSFHHLNGYGLFALFRRHSQVLCQTQSLFSKTSHDKGLLTDALVTAGVASRKKIPLRLITYQHAGKRLELLTNVLDPKKLSPQQALLLYSHRWSIERLFFDLKEVLNLKRFYGANPNAVAMQIYATALIHTAFRIAQAKIAQTHHLAPETISPAKLFPRLAAASCALAQIEVYQFEFKRLNPGRIFREPPLENFRFSKTPLLALLVEKRNDHRRTIRSLRRSTSIAYIHEFNKLS